MECEELVPERVCINCCSSDTRPCSTESFGFIHYASSMKKMKLSGLHLSQEEAKNCMGDISDYFSRGHAEGHSSCWYTCYFLLFSFFIIFQEFFKTVNPILFLWYNT